MSDFDAQQVVDAVRAGTAPETWRVFRAQRRYFYVMGIGMSALAVLCIVTPIAAAYPFGAGAGASNPWSLGLCLGPFGVLFALVAAYSFRQIPMADQQWVAVTPSGFVEYRGVRWGIARAVEYAHFSSVSLEAVSKHPRDDLACSHEQDSSHGQAMGLHPPPLTAPARTGRPRADDRRTIEGILYILITGCRWQDLPREYGAPTTVWRRLKHWGEEGVWVRIWRAALAALDAQGQLDWTMAFLDGSFVPAKKGGDKVGLTKKGKGAKWMLVVEGNGLPLGYHLDSAARAEVKLAEHTLDTIHVARLHGRPKQRPRKLVADRGYDSCAFRRALRRRGIAMCIPTKRRPARWRTRRGRPVLARREDYRERYKVERSFAWLGNFRRLLIRWEHLSGVYEALFAVAVALVCLRRLSQAPVELAMGSTSKPHAHWSDSRGA